MYRCILTSPFTKTAFLTMDTRTRLTGCWRALHLYHLPQEKRTNSTNNVNFTALQNSTFVCLLLVMRTKPKASKVKHVLSHWTAPSAHGSNMCSLLSTSPAQDSNIASVLTGHGLLALDSTLVWRVSSKHPWVPVIHYPSGRHLWQTSYEEVSALRECWFYLTPHCTAKC